jgi:uncharacterized protein (DUF1501 family)
MKRKTEEMDKAVSTLLKDLKQKGLLDSTIVWMSGEFGRTPKIDQAPPWNGGRNHHCKCFSAMVAGGGFKGGCIVGESNEFTTAVAKRPVSPQDFLGSIYELCGVDPERELPNPKRKKLSILPKSTGEGRLREIYV